MKVVCTLFKADTLIDGVKFVAHKLGTMSEEISDEVGERLLSLKGFLRVGAPPKASAAAAPAAGAAPAAAPAPAPQASAAVPAAESAAPAATPAAPAATTATPLAAK